MTLSKEELLCSQGFAREFGHVSIEEKGTVPDF